MLVATINDIQRKAVIGEGGGERRWGEGQEGLNHFQSRKTTDNFDNRIKKQNKHVL